MASNSDQRDLGAINEAYLRAKARPDRLLLLPEQIEHLTGHNTRELARLRRTGCGPASEKFGRFNVYRLSEVLTWLDEQRAAEEVLHGA